MTNPNLNKAANKTSNRKRLVLIVSLFFVPLIIATLWYTQLPDDYKPTGRTNNGMLIEPIYRLQAFTQPTLDGKSLEAAKLETVWTLVHLVDAECDAACSQSLYDTRQIRIALGKEIDRVKRIAVISDEAKAATAPKMWASHPDMVFALSAAGGLGQQIKQNVDQSAVDKNDTYLVDPLGNVMMRFPVDLDPKLMMKDIRKLLKLSRIG